ncbi:MAG TPA: DUF2844 domain-containing protein [Steroidobacteraceae bacterium]|nr:DUF2844 domain-containing protein [Steroidobacteraceae bacterium]
MKRRLIRSLHATALLTVLLFPGLFISAPAHAALGGTVDSVTADTSALRGQLRSTGFVDYDMHQISSGQLVVNEYATRAGQVFAITWHGPLPPDLQQLLGSYFPRFQSAAAAVHQANPGVHRMFDLEQSDLVIRTAGRLRAFGGIAYLPALVPSDVSIDQLQ